jgi:4-hydroxy-2-oxoheptanedioate aldolase
MDMPKNLFKQKLRQGQWQVGLFVGLASGYSMEILAGAGFDWLVIDAEHSPNNPASVLAQLQAAAPTRCRCWCDR